VRSTCVTWSPIIHVFLLGSLTRSKSCLTDASSSNKKEKNPYAETILLPETPFSQRANAAVREPELQAFWQQINLYDTLSQQAEGRPRFILHDGPPYANGDLHCGHALNKILKDFINRKQVLNGKQVHYIPGWDCHGLPIELKVLQGMDSKERQTITPIQLRQRAAAFAQTAVQKQSIGFQRFGVYGDFAHPYLTLMPEFESAQIRVFGEMFRRGYIFRGRKPVHWSPSSRTALAEAELEYPDNHVSKSIYVAFTVDTPSDSIASFHSMDDPVKIAIWTTTPWTIPANMAVAVNPAISYSIVQHETTGKMVVATDLISTLTTKLLPKDAVAAFQVLTTVTGEQLTGTTYTHPLYRSRTNLQVLIGGDYITTQSGTGLVHTAPGHGQEDYLTGLKYDLDILSPVDDVGRFTIEAGEQFVGLDVLGNGNTAVIDALNATTSLLKVENYGHKYPYDWRTNKPTIFRATDQWFASVEGFRDAALEAVESVSTLVF
jgi:isoleucyl-tRNA synthetase